MSDRDRTDDIRHEGELSGSEHKAYCIVWEHEPRKVVASFDTLNEATEAIKHCTVPGLRLDRRYVVRGPRR
jgi:hypothetical protein